MTDIIEVIQSTAVPVVDVTQGAVGPPGPPGAPGSGLPSGGSDGQLLAKSGATGTWIDPPSSLPAGGATGTILAKNSSTNGDAGWIAPPSAPVSSVAGRTGAVTLTHADMSDLGTAATKNVGTTGSDVAAGDKGLPAGGTNGQVVFNFAGVPSWVGLTSDNIADGTSNHLYTTAMRTKVNALGTAGEPPNGSVNVARLMTDVTDLITNANTDANAYTDAAVATLGGSSVDAKVAKAADLRVPDDGFYTVARNLRPSTAIHASATAVHTRMRITPRQSCNTLVLKFVNWLYGGAATQPFKLRASIDTLGPTVSGTDAPTGSVNDTTVKRVHFPGEDANFDVTIAAGATVLSLPIRGPFTAGTPVWINTRAIPTGTTGIPKMNGATRFYATTNGDRSYVQTAGTILDYTADPTTYDSNAGGFNGAGYGPYCVYGETRSWVPTWCVVGDSISEIYNDSYSSGTGDTDPSALGWANRAFQPSRGLQNAAQFGYATSNFLADSGWQSQLKNASHVIYSMGQNDYTGVQTVAQMQEMYRQVWGLLKSFGVRVLIGWIPPPKTSSTDSYTTVANQTPNRATTPVDANATYLSMATWLAGVPAPLDGVIDARTIVGSLKTDGVTWVWNPTSQTTDGIHPGRGGHIAIATAVQSLISTWEAI